MVYLGIEGRYDDLAHHNVYIPDDYERNLREVEDDHVLEFTKLPTVSADGTLNYEVAPNSSGSITFFVYATDGDCCVNVFAYGQEFCYDMPRDSAVILSLTPAPAGQPPRRSASALPDDQVVLVKAFSAVVEVPEGKKQD
jgi:hypothetical protein